MDKTTLSKHKNLYRIYINCNNEVHAERYKVVYINKKKVYYINGGEESLNSVDISNVYETTEEMFEKIDIMNFLGTCYCSLYVWTPPKENISYSSLVKMNKIAHMQKMIDRYKDQAEYHRREMKNCETRIENLKKEIEEIQ